MFGQKQPDKKWRTGRYYQVPCPWCGKPNDFRGTEEFLFDAWSGEAAASKEQQTFTCDHSECGRPMRIVRAEKTIILSVCKPGDEELG